MENSLLMICASSFAAVFVILGTLAVTMKILTALFPEKKKDEIDSAMLAAIHSVYSVVKPGARITNIVEMKSRR
jgi:hypothetical protein